MHIGKVNTSAFLCFPEKSYTLPGFKPGSPAPETDAMSTAPWRQGTEIFSATISNYFRNYRAYAIHSLFKMAALAENAFDGTTVAGIVFEK
jgi:hypothetical protein